MILLRWKKKWYQPFYWNVKLHSWFKQYYTIELYHWILGQVNGVWYLKVQIWLYVKFRQSIKRSSFACLISFHDAKKSVWWAKIRRSTVQSEHLQSYFDVEECILRIRRIVVYYCARIPTEIFYTCVDLNKLLLATSSLRNYWIDQEMFIVIRQRVRVGIETDPLKGHTGCLWKRYRKLEVLSRVI